MRNGHANCIVSKYTIKPLELLNILKTNSIGYITSGLYTYFDSLPRNNGEIVLSSRGAPSLVTCILFARQCYESLYRDSYLYPSLPAKPTV